MSRRRQSYRQYVGVTDDELHAMRYGRRQPQAVPLEAVESDSLTREPLWWLALALSALSGVALMPLAACGIWAVCWLAAVLR